MVTPRRSVAEVRWTRGFIVAFLAMTAAVMLAAQPVLAEEWELMFDVKDGGKKMRIKYDETKDKVTATMDGKELKVSEKVPFPIVLGRHTGKIAAIYPGPAIVFEGSTCVLIKNRWIGYPPGTVCP